MELLEYIESIRKFNRYYSNVLGKIDQQIYNQPFPLTEARVITEIHLKNGCTATEVRENLGIDRGYMSRIVQRFEEEKIITKKQSSVDKRHYSLYLTEKGAGIYKNLVENANRGVEKMIRNLSKSDLAQLVTSMQTIESIYSREHPSQLDITIRRFQPGEIGYVAHLHGKLYDQTYQFGPMFEYYVMKGLTEFMLNTEGGELWVAEVNGKIAGSIAITKSTDTIAQLRWFVLNEEFQGIGLGKRLMETALGFCKEQNYEQVFLWTVSSLHPARHLYQKYHFKLTEEKPNEEWTDAKLIEERWDLQLSEQDTY